MFVLSVLTFSLFTFDFVLVTFFYFLHCLIVAFSLFYNFLLFPVDLFYLSRFFTSTFWNLILTFSDICGILFMFFQNF